MCIALKRMRAINKDQSVISFGSKRFSDLRSRSRPSRYIFRRRREIISRTPYPRAKPTTRIRTMNGTICGIIRRVGIYIKKLGDNVNSTGQVPKPNHYSSSQMKLPITATSRRNDRTTLPSNKSKRFSAGRSPARIYPTNSGFRLASCSNRNCLSS